MPSCHKILVSIFLRSAFIFIYTATLLFNLIMVMLLGYPLAYHFENDSIVFSDGFYDNIITQKFLNVAGFVIRNSMLGFLII
jgi:hypothetical protein